jgi:hypothetical protein
MTDERLAQLTPEEFSTWAVESRERWKTLAHKLERELDEAQEAADTYHEAWQDASVYWKSSRDEARNLVRALLKSGLHPLEREAWEREFPWLKEPADEA